MSKRRWIEVTLAVFYACLVAIASLLIEDLTLAGGEDAAPEARIGLRVAIMLGTLAVAVGLFVSLTRMDDKRGTVHFVSYLAEFMPDNFDKYRTEAMKSHKARRFIGSKWDGRRSNDGVDMTAGVESVDADLRRSLSEDDTGTGYTIAPNLLFPAALGVGYLMSAWPGCHMWDMNPQVDVHWRLPERFDDLGKLKVVKQEGETGASAVLVVLNATDFHQKMPPGALPRLAATYALASDETSAVTIVSDTRRGRRSATHGQIKDGKLEVLPEHLVSTSLEAVRIALDEHPEAQVLVFARLPKTVSLALGWALQRAVADKRGASPWSRLVPLHVDPAIKETLLARVLPFQPPMDDIVARYRGSFRQSVPSGILTLLRRSPSPPATRGRRC